MAKTDKVCFDRILPSELNTNRPERTIILTNGRARAVFLPAKLWPNGSNITISFIGGTTQQHNLVKSIAPQWTEHANLSFEFLDDGQGQVRISFEDSGAWSFVGTDALNIVNQATMNFGWLDEAVILHEFGHMIGMGHEHQNPTDNPIQWDVDEVNAALAGPPNFWDPQTIQRNVLNRYDLSQINGSSFDPDSIMLYSFPAHWTTNGFTTDPNEQLSEMDKLFASRVYPSTETEIPELPVLEGFKGQIGQPGEEDLYKFTVTAKDQYTIETGGNTDLVMKLFDGSQQLIGQDDDSGQGRNSRIISDLNPGEYTIQVRHYNEARGVGEYSISVFR